MERFQYVQSKLSMYRKEILLYFLRGQDKMFKTMKWMIYEKQEVFFKQIKNMWNNHTTVLFYVKLKQYFLNYICTYKQAFCTHKSFKLILLNIVLHYNILTFSPKKVFKSFMIFLSQLYPVIIFIFKKAVLHT